MDAKVTEARYPRVPRRQVLGEAAESEGDKSVERRFEGRLDECAGVNRDVL